MPQSIGGSRNMDMSSYRKFNLLLIGAHLAGAVIIH
jgi:hypothetical protein